ncbi:hypothetical protein FA95DRAFT_1596260 [Auriscalpium vulgare]|uniref:Uncharacterized protein n=1 Tax=Auriscalpium vulgare TaxID=40419 RepID=A0ACB8RQA6_9AGAM|nr:hypothetical protein FA95DRAFT_1596260 [Auriscalpium vulgare]
MLISPSPDSAFGEPSPGVFPNVGALLIGAVLSSSLAGVTVYQTVAYFTQFPNDGLDPKIWVLLIWLFDFLAAVLHSAMAYIYFVKHRDDPAFIAFSIWAWGAGNIAMVRTVPAFKSLIQFLFGTGFDYPSRATILHCPYLETYARATSLLSRSIDGQHVCLSRIHSASNRIPTLQMHQSHHFCYIQWSRSVHTGFWSNPRIYGPRLRRVRASTRAVVSSIFNRMKWLKMIMKQAHKPVYNSNVAIETTLDILMTAMLIHILHQHRNEFTQRKSPFARLVVFFLTRGCVIAAYKVILLLVPHIVGNSYIWVPLIFCLSRVYANSAIMTLNNRRHASDIDNLPGDERPSFHLALPTQSTLDDIPLDTSLHPRTDSYASEHAHAASAASASNPSGLTDARSPHAPEGAHEELEEDVRKLNIVLDRLMTLTYLAYLIASSRHLLRTVRTREIVEKRSLGASDAVRFGATSIFNLDRRQMDSRLSVFRSVTGHHYCCFCSSSCVFPNVGALLIGAVLSSFLVGVTAYQTLLYFTSFPGDKLSLKIWVLLIWLFDFLAAVLHSFMVYIYFVNHRDEPLFIAFKIWAWDAGSLAMGLTTFTVQLFFIASIWRLRQIVYPQYRFLNLTMCTIFSALAVYTQGSSITIAYMDLSNRHNPEPSPRVKPIFNSNVGTETALDILITASLIHILHQHRNEFAQRKSPFTQLLAFFLTRGCVIAGYQIILLIVPLLAGVSYTWVPLLFCLSRVYANSAIMTLNNRRQPRDMHDQTGDERPSFHVTLPTIHFTSADHQLDSFRDSRINCDFPHNASFASNSSGFLDARPPPHASAGARAPHRRG